MKRLLHEFWPMVVLCLLLLQGCRACQLLLPPRPARRGADVLPPPEYPAPYLFRADSTERSFRPSWLAPYQQTNYLTPTNRRRL